MELGCSQTKSTYTREKWQLGSGPTHFGSGQKLSSHTEPRHREKDTRIKPWENEKAKRPFLEICFTFQYFLIATSEKKNDKIAQFHNANSPFILSSPVKFDRPMSPAYPFLGKWVALRQIRLPNDLINDGL